LRNDSGGKKENFSIKKQKLSEKDLGGLYLRKILCKIYYVRWIFRYAKLSKVMEQMLNAQRLNSCLNSRKYWG